MDDTLNPFIIVAAYIRVSTDDQLEYSPDSQLKLIREYAKKNRMFLPDEFVFVDEGISGRSTKKRKRFNEMISLAKTKPCPFEKILVWKFSRFARNQEESIVYKSLLSKQYGIEVVSISEPLIDGPFGSLIERIIEWMDEYYSIRLAGEVKRGMIERVGRGKPVCPPPIGYISEKENYVPSKDAETVKAIFADYLSGMGLRALAVKYGKLGLRTTRGKEPDNRCIEYILRNPVYTGKIRWSTEGRAASRRKFDDPNIMIVPGHHEALISQEDFDAAQRILDETKKRYPKYQRREQPIGYMLKGLVRCSACGATLVLVKTTHPSLQCHNYGRGACKTSHSILISKAEDDVIAYLNNVIISKDFHIDAPPPPKQDGTDYELLIGREQEKLRRIKKAYLDGIDTLEEYRANKQVVLAIIEKLIQERQNSQAAAPEHFDVEKFSDKVKSVLEVVSSPDYSAQEKNAALRTIIKRIVFNKAEKRLDLFFYV